MKTKTNFFKLCLCFVAFAIFSVLFAFAPTLTTFAAELNNYAYVFSMTNMPDRVVDISENGEFLIPIPTTQMGTTWTSYKIIVKDASGQTHTYSSNEDNAEDTYFTLDGEYVKVNTTVAGQYDVYYELTGDIGTVRSNAYKVTLINTTYEIDFSIFEGGVDTGLDALIPSQIKLGESFTLPTAYVKEADSDEIFTDRTVTLKVTNSNGEEVLLTDNVFTTGSETNENNVGSYTIEYSYVGGTNNPTVTFTIDVVSEEDYETPTETNIVTPTFPSFELGDTEITLPRVTVNERYENTTKNNVDYNIKSITIQKENSEFKQTLSNNSLVFDMTLDAFKDSNDASPTSYKDLVGNYTITYEIETAYTTLTRTYRITNVNFVSNPEVYMAYNYTAGDTDVDTNYAVDLRANYGYNEIVLPAIYATDKVSASDDLIVVRYLQRNSDNRIFYVDNKAIDGGELVTIDEDYLASHTNVSINQATLNTGDDYYTKAQVFSFLKEPVREDYDSDEAYQTAHQEYLDEIADYAGEYTLYYQVYSKVSEKTNYVYSSGTTRYTINIVADANYTADTESIPSISFSNFTNRSVNPTDEFEIAVSATDDNDTRVKTAMYYFYDENDADLEETIRNALNAAANEDTNTIGLTSNILDSSAFISSMQDTYSTFTQLTTSEDANTFDFKLADYENQTSVTVVAIAFNDDIQFGYVTRMLSLRNTTNDSDAPTAIVDTENSSFTATGDSDTVLTLTGVKQFDEVTLPTIRFSDLDASLNISVMYYVKKNEDDTTYAYKYPNNYALAGNNVVGGTITATQAGTYYVVYTATDDAGNTTTVFVTFEATENTDRILEVETSLGSSTSVEQGETVTFYPTVYDYTHTEDLTDTYYDDISIIDVKASGRYELVEDDVYSYKFYGVGAYTFTFQLTNGESEPITQEVIINVTSATLDWDSEPSISSTAVAGETIDLGAPTAMLAGERADITVTVTTPSSTTVDAVYDNDHWTYTVPATGNNINGTYTVTYTAKTDNLTISETRTFRVGDLEAPKITLKVADSDLTRDIVYNGTDITYTIEKVTTPSTDRKVVITVRRGDEQIYSYEIMDRTTGLSDNNATSTRLWNNLTVTLTSDNGSITSEEDGNITTYTISATGEYTLTIKTYDNATESTSNVGTKTLTFSIKAESTPDDENDNVVGVVLIVLSLVVLAGVILFFAFTGKGGKGGKNSKSKKTASKKEEEIEQVSEDDSTSDEAKTGEVEE